MKGFLVLKSVDAMLASGMTIPQVAAAHIKAMADMLTGNLVVDPNYQFNITDHPTVKCEDITIMATKYAAALPSVILRHTKDGISVYITIAVTVSTTVAYFTKVVSVHKDYDPVTETVSNVLIPNTTLLFPYMDASTNSLQSSEVRMAFFSYTNAVGFIREVLVSSVRVTVPFILTNRQISPYMQPAEDLQTRLTLFLNSLATITPVIQGYAPNISLVSALRTYALLTSFGVNPTVVPALRNPTTGEVFNILSDCYVLDVANNVPYMKIVDIYKYSNYSTINSMLSQFEFEGRTFISIDSYVHTGLALEITNDIIP